MGSAAEIAWGTPIDNWRSPSHPKSSLSEHVCWYNVSNDYICHGSPKTTNPNRLKPMTGDVLGHRLSNVLQLLSCLARDFNLLPKWIWMVKSKPLMRYENHLGHTKTTCFWKSSERKQNQSLSHDPGHSRIDRGGDLGWPQLGQGANIQESIHEGILVAEAFDKFLGCLGHHGSAQSQVDWVSHKDPTRVPFWNPTKTDGSKVWKVFIAFQVNNFEPERVFLSTC